MFSEKNSPAAHVRESSTHLRLDSWKEIATHLKRDIRTAQLWEKREGLPVHRQTHIARANVFALTHELDAWQSARHAQPAVVCAIAASDGTLPASAANAPGGDIRWRQAALVVAAAAVAAAAVTAAVFVRGSMLRQKTVHAKMEASLRGKTLAVFPFADHSPEPREPYLAAGLTDDLVTDIGRSGLLHVVSPEASDSALQMARANLVIEGTVLRLGQQTRVTVRLIDTATGRDVWDESYKRSSSDVLALQDDVAREIAAGVIDNLTDGQQLSARN